jgi:hypothetical protein
MDYVIAQYPPKFIQGLFELTDKQIHGALAYIEADRVNVEAEYQQVIREGEELRQYYTEQNRQRIAQIAQTAMEQPKPGTEAAWEKLRAAKTKRQLVV